MICALAVSVAAGVGASAQQWPLHVPEPPLEASRVSKDVRFASVDSSNLLMDVYRPSGGTGTFPAVIFYTLYWPAEGGSGRASNDWYKSWGRLAAANGIVAIVPDLRAEPGTGNAEKPARAAGDDFPRLVRHLVEHASEYGIDADRIGVFAESGATWAALPAVQDPNQTAIKAAVMYYGSASIETFRRDLPLLWVRAGLDSARTNAEIARLSALALSQNAPVTILNHPTGHHGFEGRDDNAITREVIEQTLSFLKRATMPLFQAEIRKNAVGTRD
jgi:dienelactone hydrolase